MPAATLPGGALQSTSLGSSTGLRLQHILLPDGLEGSNAFATALFGVRSKAASTKGDSAANVEGLQRVAD